MRKLFSDKSVIPNIITDHIEVIENEPSNDKKICYLGILGDKIYLYTKDNVQ